MDDAEKKTEIVQALAASHADLTNAQREAIADAMIAREAERYGSGGMWSWCVDAGERAEQIGYRIENMRRENSALFVPPPDAKTVYNALLAKLKAEITDPAHPQHPDQADVRRNLWRQVSLMSADQRAEAVKGLTVAPEAAPAPETQEQVAQTAPRFTDPFSHEFEDHVHRRLGIAPHALGARKRQELFAFVNRTDQQARKDKHTLAVAETKAQTRQLTLAERREQARAQGRLARAAR